MVFYGYINETTKLSIIRQISLGNDRRKEKSVEKEKKQSLCTIKICLML